MPRESPRQSAAIRPRPRRCSTGTAERDGLALAIHDERTRREARDRVAALAHGMDDVAGDLDGLLARAGDAAGNDPAKADAYRAAALGLRHGARQARDAAEDAAWIGVLPHLTGGAVTAWTDLPADVWRALSPRQQAAVRERTENPYGESDPVVLARLKDMVAKDPAGFRSWPWENCLNVSGDAGYGQGQGPLEMSGL
jgi:hypothetical protein